MKQTCPFCKKTFDTAPEPTPVIKERPPIDSKEEIEKAREGKKYLIEKQMKELQEGV